jgi:uncharacterized membrane protein YsdA (DUF1294 family)
MLTVFLMLYLPAINAIAFAIYGIDKERAQANLWRVSEGTLLFVSLIGGSVGAFAAQQFFHHKTRKESFQARFWFIVQCQIVYIAAALFAASDFGAAWIASFHVSPSSSS